MAEFTVYFPFERNAFSWDCKAFTDPLVAGSPIRAMKPENGKVSEISQARFQHALTVT